jgi:hypothetical protein
LVIRAEGERPVGSAHQLVVVPEWWSAPSVFGLHVQSGKLEAPVVRPRMAGERDRNMTLTYRPAAPGDPAIRSFRPGETLQYDAQIANITDPTAEIRITRADSDPATAVYTAKAGTVHDDAVSGTYTIENSLPPGSYDLQLIVNGKAANGRPYNGLETVAFDCRSNPDEHSALRHPRHSAPGQRGRCPSAKCHPVGVSTI